MTPAPRLLQLMTWGMALAILPVAVNEALWPILVFFWGGLLVLSGLDLLALSRGKPHVEITPPPQASVGEPFPVDVLMHLELRTPLQCRLIAETQPPLLPGKEFASTLYPGATELTIEMEAPQRGEGALEALWIKLLGPFGMLHRNIRHEYEGNPIPVVPSLPRVRRIALQHFGAWQYRGGIRLEQLPGDGSEFDALEAYVPGHDLRSVDWKASARHQALRVRRFRVERNQRLVLCLDTGRLMADPLGDLQRLDHAIHASLLLSYFALKAGDLVGLYGYDSEPHSWFPPATGMRNFKRLHHASAGLHPKFVETNHVLGLYGMLRKLNRRTLVIVFSDFTDATSAELMVETLEHLVRKHLVIFVALDDPLIETPLLQQPESVEQVAEALVASDLKVERHKVLKQLQKKGVHIVHGPPDGAAVNLVARYTEIKRRELLG